MSTNLEYTARERLRKRESRRQASEAQQEKELQYALRLTGIATQQQWETIEPTKQLICSSRSEAFSSLQDMFLKLNIRKSACLLQRN
ncbi:unnamed protein product [Porites evermanni]|uniref:Uncharacterized protein n=1 Tax=Porites evermanni TaxID=104178 RepID=A0ABN8LI15_9CNID|nr:unnamed protein product [Porites evermanni]